MTTNQLEELQDLHRQQYQILKAAHRKKVICKWNYPRCFFYLNILAGFAFLLTNAMAKYNAFK